MTCLLSADEVMANILHLAQNMDEALPAPAMPALDGPTPPICSCVNVSRGSNCGHGHNPLGTRGGRGMPMKCNASGSLNHIMSSCTASDDALMKWTLSKCKMIIQKYGTPGGPAFAQGAQPGDVSPDDHGVMPTLEDCTDENDDTEVSAPFSS
jgi:hypothetical protein